MKNILLFNVHQALSKLNCNCYNREHKNEENQPKWQMHRQLHSLLAIYLIPIINIIGFFFSKKLFFFKMNWNKPLLVDEIIQLKMIDYKGKWLQLKRKQLWYHLFEQSTKKKLNFKMFIFFKKYFTSLRVPTRWTNGFW